MRSLFFVTLIILLTHSSCRELVTDEFPGFTPVPAVNSVLIAGKPLKVHVSLAEKLDTNQLTMINDADISLYIDGNYAENLLSVRFAIYRSNRQTHQ